MFNLCSFLIKWTNFFCCLYYSNENFTMYFSLLLLLYYVNEKFWGKCVKLLMFNAKFK